MEIMFIILSIMAVLSIGLAIFKKNIFQCLYVSLNNQNYDYFYSHIDARSAKAFLPIYVREQMRLNADMKSKSSEIVTQQFNKILKMKLNNYQLIDMLVKGYHYYLLDKDRNKCCKILEKMKECMNEEQLQKYEMHYQIVFNHSLLYIHELEISLKEHRGKMKGYLEYLLAKSYQSHNDIFHYKFYLKKAAEDCKSNVEHIEQSIQVM